MQGRSKAANLTYTSKSESLMMQLFRRTEQKEKEMLETAAKMQHGAKCDHDLHISMEEVSSHGLDKFYHEWKAHRERYNSSMQTKMQEVDQEVRRESIRQLQDHYADLFLREAIAAADGEWSQLQPHERQGFLCPRARVLYTMSYQEAQKKCFGTEHKPSISFPWAVAAKQLLEWKRIKRVDREHQW